MQRTTPFTRAEILLTTIDYTFDTLYIKLNIIKLSLICNSLIT